MNAANDDYYDIDEIMCKRDSKEASDTIDDCLKRKIGDFWTILIKSDI